MTERSAAIIGLGLIGGSLARDLTAHGVRVLGTDRNRDSVAAALEARAIVAPLGRRYTGIERVDWVVIAVPVDAASEVIARLARMRVRPRLVTDVGSTKRSIVARAGETALAAAFVGAHPLAGDHRAGWVASRGGLFSGRRVYLCPTPQSDAVALRESRLLWRMCGARPELMQADAHDARMALISHLPQLLASTLALELRAARIPKEALGTGGRDMTRLAASAPDLWVSIALDNADHVATALARHETAVADLRSMIERGDRTTLRRLLGRARVWSKARSG